MTHTRTWPSRRLQLKIVVALVIGAALTIIIPPISVEKRAERLYHDAWFAGGFLPHFEWGQVRTENAIPKLKRVLELSPGNDLYEQALVWHYPREELPGLLQDRQLGVNATSLAAGLIYRNEKRQDTSDDLVQELERLDALLEADPSNALVHYQRASVFLEMGEMEEAIHEIRLGNHIGVLKAYSPDVSNTVMDSSVSPLISRSTGDSALWRRLAREFTGRANDYLRQGRVDEAREILENCVEMSIIISSTEPATYIDFLVGKAILSISSAQLTPIYKDFGMDDSLAALQRLTYESDRGLEVVRASIGDVDMIGEPILRRAVVLIYALPGAVIGLGLMAIGSFGWLTAHIARRLRREDKLNLSPWMEGWLARVFLAVWIPAFLAVLAIVFLRPSFFVSEFYDVEVWQTNTVIASLILIAHVLVVGIALRILHHRYDEHTGERTSMLRFIFKSSATAKAWTRKYVIAALGAQIIFIGCVFLLAIIIYNPAFDMHPWQVFRAPVDYYMSHEQARMKEISTDLRNAYVGGSDNEGSVD